MKYFSYFLLLFYCCCAYSQKLVTKEDIVYGKAVGFHNQPVELKLDVVSPESQKKFPLVVYLHGGGFSEEYTKEGGIPFCGRLAAKGFVVVNMDYRGGFDSSGEDYRTTISKALYRAQQDNMAAIRFLIHHANEYHIDTSLVFVAGESAGAVTAVFTAYVTQEEWDSAAPLLRPNLGAINTCGNELRDMFTIKGVISMCGGIADTALISRQEMQQIPILLFHSISDNTIAFEFSSNPKATDRLTEGARDIANRFKNNNACYQLHYIKYAAHCGGFSGDYITSTISNFVKDIHVGICNSVEIERDPRNNPTLGRGDSDDDAFPYEDDKIIKLSPEILQQYAGNYEGGGDIIIIKVEGDHLVAQSQAGEPILIFPLGNNIFLYKRFNFRVEFVKDSQGKIVEHIVRLTKNRELHYKKID